MMEHTNDHGVYGRPHPEQQQRRSSRIIRHVMLFLIVTLTTIVLTSSCASADSPIHATTVLVGSVPGESSARQELTALVPDAVDSPLRIVLRSEDLIKIPCGMARETSVQLVNSHKTETIKILYMEVLTECEASAYEYETTYTSQNPPIDEVDPADFDELRGPQRSVAVASFRQTILKPGESCTAVLEIVPRRFDGVADHIPDNTVDLLFRNSIFVTLITILPLPGETTTADGEPMFKEKVVSFKVGGSAVRNPLRLPEYILMIQPQPDAQNTSCDYEADTTNEGYIMLWGDCGDAVIEFAAEVPSGGGYGNVSISSAKTYSLLFDAHISLKKECECGDLVPSLVWRWKDPLTELSTNLSDPLLIRDAASELVELSQNVKTGIVRWGDLRLKFKNGDTYVIEIRLDLTKSDQNFFSQIKNVTLLEALLNATKELLERTTSSCPKIAAQYEFDKALQVSSAKIKTDQSASGLSPVITIHGTTQVIEDVDFGTIYGPDDDESISGEAISSDVLDIGIQNGDSIAVKVLRIEQIEYSFKSLESPSKKIPDHLLRGENKYLKIHTPTPLNTLIISPKETTTKLIQLSHGFTPQSAMLSGKIRIITNHFNEDLASIDLFYKVRILRGHIDFDVGADNNDISTNQLDGSKPKSRHIVKKEKSKSNYIWWNVPVSSSTLEWAHRARKPHSPLINAHRAPKSLSKRLNFRNTYPVPVQINYIQLSDSCAGVARLWLLPAHPWTNGTRYLFPGNYNADKSLTNHSNTIPEWGIIPGFGGTWSGFAEIEIFGELINISAPTNYTTANVSNNRTVGSGLPFVCHLFLSNNISFRALPIMMYDSNVRYSPGIRWDASRINQQPPTSSDTALPFGTRVANVVHGLSSKSFSFSGSDGSNEEEYSRILKQGWELLHKLNHARLPCDRKVPAKKNTRRNLDTKSQPEIDESSATDSLEYLNINIGSLHADGSFQTTSFYITNLNPVPVEIEARGHFHGMKLELGSKAANIVDFVPKKVNTADYSSSDQNSRLASNLDRSNAASLTKGSELNFDFITSSKTSVLAKLGLQQDISLSPMVYSPELWDASANGGTNNVTGMIQFWENLYSKHNMVTLFRSGNLSEAQDQLHLSEYLISWDDYCKRLNNDDIKERSSPFSHLFQHRDNDKFVASDSPTYGCLVSADDEQILVWKPLTPSGEALMPTEIVTPKGTSWVIPPGAAARVELTVQAPHHSLLSRDVSNFFGFGLGLFNKATQREIPLVVNYHAIRGHILLREPHGRTIHKSSPRITVPCLLFSHASWSNGTVASSMHNVPQLRRFLSAPLEVVSTFSNPVRLLSAQSTCTSIFQFDRTFSRDVPPQSSGVDVGHVALHLSCNAGGDGQLTMFNFYSCAHSWLRLRYQTIACKQAGMRESERNHAASESEAVIRALRLSEELMQIMSQRFRDFYGRLQGQPGAAAQTHGEEDAFSSGKTCVSDGVHVYNEDSLMIPSATGSAISSSFRATRSTVISEYNAHVSPLETTLSNSIADNESRSTRVPMSPSVLIPSVRNDPNNRPLALTLLHKVESFYRQWDQGIKRFNWNIIEDEIEINVGVRQVNQQINLTSSGEQESSVWKEVSIRAASSLSNTTTGMKADTAVLRSSISLPRISTSSSLHFLSPRSSSKQDYNEKVTPIAFVSRGYVVVKNPSAVPITVRLSAAEDIEDDTVSVVKNRFTVFEGRKPEVEVFEMKYSPLYFQPVSPLSMLNSSGRLNANTPNTRAKASTSTQFWWNGGSYFMYSLVSNRLLQASHNITIRSAGGTHVSLINPSMQAVNALSIGCGQRCGLRHDVMTPERFEAPLGAISSRNSDWIKGDSGLSTANPAAFAIPLSAQVEKVIPPFASAKMGPIMFRPPSRGCFSGSLIVENSLSGAERIDLFGVGGVEELRLESWRIEDDTVSYEQFVPPFRAAVSIEYRSRKNPYTIGVSNIENRNNHPTLVFSGTSNPHTHAAFVKTVHVTNSGDVPIEIERVYLGSSEIVYHTMLRPHPDDYHWLFSHAKEGCEYNGFRILGCITDAEEKTRVNKFQNSLFAPLRRWFVGKDIVNMYNALPENSSNTAEGFNLLPGESTQIHIAHVADCSFQKMYATLHLQYKGRSSASPDNEAKPWRQNFQSHEETLLVGYEMTSNELVNECQIAKPRAQGMIFSKSGRDPIGMHVRGEYPIAYYAIDSLFNWMARRYTVGPSTVSADYAYLFVYTASMFVEHSTVALLVSIAFLLFFHALIFLVDRASQSKAFRDMWRDNIALRESTKAGWRNMLLLGRSCSDAHIANVEGLQRAARDVVKVGTVNALKPTQTIGGGMPLACIAPDGGFVPRVCPNSAGSTISGKDPTDQRLNPARAAQQQTLSEAIFWQLEGKELSEFLPAGLGWRPATSAAPDVFYDTSESNKHETRSSNLSQLLKRRKDKAELPKFEERDLEIEISFNDDDDHSVLELESEDEFEQVSRQESSSSELDESMDSVESADENDDKNDNNRIHGDLSLEQKDSASSDWYVQRIHSRKGMASNGNGDVEPITVAKETAPLPFDAGTNVQKLSIPSNDERSKIHSTSVEKASTSLSPKHDSARRAEIITGKGNVEATVLKRRVVTSRVAMSLEKRAAAKGAPVNAWRTTSTASHQSLPPQPATSKREQRTGPSNSSFGSSSSGESYVESPSLPRSSPQSNPQENVAPSSSEADSSNVGHRTYSLHSRVLMESAIPSLPFVPKRPEGESVAPHASFEPSSPNQKQVDCKKVSARAPPGLAPPPGFESSPISSQKMSAEETVETERLGHVRVGTLTSDPWASGVDFTQSFPLGPLSIVRGASETTQPNIGPILETQRTESHNVSPAMRGISVIGHISNATAVPPGKLSETGSSLGTVPLRAEGGLVDLALRGSYSSMGLFNVENFLGFLDEDDNKEESQNNPDEDPLSYSTPLATLRKSADDGLSEDYMKDLWDPSSGLILSPSLVRARASVATAIGGERVTGNPSSSPSSGWISHQVDSLPISGLGSGLLKPSDLLKSSSVDNSDIPLTKRNPFFAHWMSEASEDFPNDGQSSDRTSF